MRFDIQISQWECKNLIHRLDEMSDEEWEHLTRLAEGNSVLRFHVVDREKNQGRILESPLFLTEGNGSEAMTAGLRAVSEAIQKQLGWS